MSDHEQDRIRLSNSLAPGRVDLNGAVTVQVACGLQHSGPALSLCLFVLLAVALLVSSSLCGQVIIIIITCDHHLISVFLGNC